MNAGQKEQKEQLVNQINHNVFLIELINEAHPDKHFYFSVDYDGEGCWWVTWTEVTGRAIQFTRPEDAAKMRAGLLFKTDTKVSEVLVDI